MKEPVRRFTLASWLSIYGRDCYADFVKAADYEALERENVQLLDVIRSARSNAPFSTELWVYLNAAVCAYEARHATKHAPDPAAALMDATFKALPKIP